MSKLKFLVIEDDLFYQTYVNDLLVETGVDIITASEGETGLRLALTEKPDLILTDIEIPKIQGFVLLRTLKDRAETKDIPVILMSGKVEKDLLALHSQLHVHANGYLMKPFSGQDLVKLIIQILGPKAQFLSGRKVEEGGEGEHHGAGDIEIPELAIGSNAKPHAETGLAGPLRVLVVDDSQYICDIASDFLKEAGFEVTEALNGEDGLKAALRIRPHLIFLDVQMPGMNGFVVCEMLRKEETTKDVPIILMSAVIDGESFERHSKLKYHADAYLQKPFMKSELQDLARQCIPSGSVVSQVLERRTGFFFPSEDEVPGSRPGDEARQDPFSDPRVRKELEKNGAEIAELRGRETELSDRLEKTVFEKDQLEEEVFSLRSGKNSREQELQDKLTLATQRFEETRGRLENLEKENITLKDEIEKVIRGKEEEQSAEGPEEGTVSEEEVRGFLREIEELKRDLAAAISAKAEIEEQADVFLKDRERKEHSENLSLKDQVEKYSGENRELRERLDDAEARIKGINGVESELQGARGEIRDLRQQLDHVRLQFEEAKKSAADETATRIDLENRIEEAGREKQLIASEVEEAGKRLNEMNAIISAGEAIRKEIEEEKALRAGAEAEIQILREKTARLEDISSKLTGVKEKCSVLERELGESEKNRRELEGKLREKEDVEANRLNDRLEHMEATLSRTVLEAQEVITSQKDRENELRERLDTLVGALDVEKEALRRERELWRKKEEELKYAFEDALVENRRIIGEEASRLFPMPLPRPGRPLEVVTGTRKLLFAAILALIFLLVFLSGYLVLSRIGIDKKQAFSPEIGSDLPAGDIDARPGAWIPTQTDVLSYEDIWRRQTAQSVSDDMMIQATLHSRRELEAAILYTALKEGWTTRRKEKTLEEVLRTYDLEGSFFITIFTKNLKGGYPGYAENIQQHVALRDDTGKEAMAFLPSDLERSKSVTSRVSAAGKEMNPVFMYEVGVTLAFPRDAMAAEPVGLELVLYDVGAVPERVLTWDLSTMGPLSFRNLAAGEKVGAAVRA